MSPARIILVREWDGQHTGSGCCGRLPGGDSLLAGAADFGHSRAIMTAMGEVYTALRGRYPDADIEVVDPRNSPWLVPAVWRDARRRGRGSFEALRASLRAPAAAAVIVDGAVLFCGEPPDPERVIRTIEQPGGVDHAA